VSEGCHLQWFATVPSTAKHAVSGSRTRFAILFLLPTFLGAAGSCLAQDAAKRSDAIVAEVVIQAEREADEQVTRQVEKTLTEDRWIFSDHLTVTTRNGVVQIEGIVQDTAEWLRILRLARKTPGARRVVDRMEMLHNDPDGG
jgi:BON domain